MDASFVVLSVISSVFSCIDHSCFKLSIVFDAVSFAKVLILVTSSILSKYVR